MLNPAVQSPRVYVLLLWSYSASNIETSKCRKSIFTLHLNHITMPQELLPRTDLHNLDMLNPVVQFPCPYLSPLWSYSASNIKISEIIHSIFIFTLHLNHLPRPQVLLPRIDIHNMNMLNPLVNPPCLYLSSLWSYSASNIETSKCRKSSHPPSAPHPNATITASHRRFTHSEHAESSRRYPLSISLAVVELLPFKHRKFKMSEIISPPI
jgi:hypothetical protein